MLTDQTSAHDTLNGYVPLPRSPGEDLDRLRREHPQEYVRRAVESIGVQVRAMLELQARGAITFDYGNNIRAQAVEAGVADAFRIPGFIPEYIRPLFCEGRGPFRWVALSGDPEDIYRTDRGRAGDVPARRIAGALDQAGARARRISRACRPASAGWATASGPGSACVSTTWWPAAS